MLKFLTQRLQTKIIAAFVLLLTIPIAIQVIYNSVITTREVLAAAESEELANITLQARAVENALSNIQDEVQFLSDTPSVRAYIEATANGDSSIDVTEELRRTADVFLSLSNNTAIFDQVRLINQAGREVVRVNYVNGQAVLVPEAELQDQSSRPYYTETMALPDGGLYISQLNLNRERGAIEEPFKPVIRYATPVYTSAGQPGGMVILNVLAENFLSLLNADAEDEQVYLIDSDGTYLFSADATLLHGRDFENGITYSSRFPNDATYLTSVPRDGLVVDGTTDAPDRFVTFARVSPPGQESAIQWTLVHNQPRANILQTVTAQRNTQIAVGVITALLAIGAAVVFSNTISNPLRKLAEVAQQIGQGKWNTPIPRLQTQDEVAQLATAFSRMSDELQASYSTLEQRVSDRTRDLQTAADVSNQISTTLDLDALLKNVTDLTKEGFNLYHSHIYLLDDDAQRLTLKAGAGEIGDRMTAEGRTIDYANPNSIVARAARSRRSVIVNDVRSGQGFLPHPLLPDTRSEMAVPLVVGETLVGVLDVQANALNHFRAAEEQVFSVMGNQIAVAIQNAQSFRRIEEARAETARIYELSTDLIGTAENGYLKVLNPAWEQTLGWSLDELRAKPFLEFVHPEDQQPTLDEYLRQLTEKRPSIQFENRYMTKDGDYRWLSWNAVPQGDITYFVTRDITLTREADQRIRLYADVMQNTPVGLHVWRLEKLDDPTSLRMVAANAASRDATGIAPEALIGKRMAEAFPGLMQTQIPHIYAALARGGSPIDLGEVTYGDENVRPSVFAVKAFSLPNNSVGVSFENITERKKQEQEIADRAREIETVALVGAEITTSLNAENLLWNIANVTRENFQRYHVNIYLLEENGESLALAAASGEVGVKLVERGHRIPLNIQHSLVARAARERQPIRVDDVTQTIDFLANPLLPNTRSELAVPIMATNHMVGVLDIQDSKVGAFSETEMQAKQILANQIAVAIENATAFRAVEEARAETARIYELSTDLIGTAENGYLKVLNPAWEQTLGWSLDELRAKPFLEFVHPEDQQPTLDEYVRQLGEKRPSIQFENRYLTKDGGFRWLSWNAVPQGDTTYFVTRDVTDLKNAEEDRNRLYNSSINLLGSAGFDGYFKDLNPAWSATLGWSNEELMSKPYVEFVHPDDVERTNYEANEQLAAGFKTLSFINRYLTKDGDYRWLSWNSTPDVQSGLIYFVARDVTLTREAEERIRKLNELQQAILTGADYAIISTTAEGVITSFNAAAERMLGYSAHEMVNKLTPAVFHDLGEVVARAHEFSQELNTPIEPGFEVFVAKARHNLPNEYEWTYIAKDGRRFPVLLNVTAMRDARGNITGFLGLAADITDRKRAQKLIEDLRLAMDQSAIVAITDVTGKITYVNDRFCTVSKYTREELIGQDHRIINSNYHSKEFIRDLWVTIANGQVWKGEIRNRAKDGTLYWVDTTIVPLMNAEGKPEEYIAVRFEITERKQQEQLIADRAREIETVAQVGTEITTNLDLDNLLWSLSNQVQQNFSRYYAQVYLYDPNTDSLVLRAGAGEVGQQLVSRGHAIPRTRQQSLVARAAREGRPIVVQDINSEPGHLANPMLPNTQAEAALPMMFGEELLGVLDIQDDKLNAFDSTQIQAQQVLANQIAIAIRNARAYAEADELRLRAEILSGVTGALSQAQNEQEILDVISALAERYNVALSTLSYFHSNEDRQVIGAELVAARSGDGQAVPLEFFPSTYFTRQEFPIIDQMLQTPNELLRIPDSEALTDEKNTSVRAYLAATGLRAFIGMAAYIGQDWLATVSLTWADPQQFDPDLLDLLTALQPTLTSVIATRRAFLETEAAREQNARRARELETVARVSAASTSILDVEQLLLSVAELTKEAFSLYHAHIYLFDEDHQSLILAAGAGEPGRLMKANRHRIPLARRNSLVVQAALTRQGVIANDVTLSADFLPNPMLPNTRSELAVPMIVADRLIGVLDVQSEQINRFSDDDVRVQETLADQIAVAIENARSYSEAAERAQRSAEIAERLRDVDRLKSQFLANMSHELRTPLNSIIGYSEVLLDGVDGDLTEDAHEDVLAIHNSGKHLLSLINEILDLAKIEAGEMRLDLRPINLAEITQDVLRTSQVLVKDKPVELLLAAEDNLPRVVGDSIRIRQIILNLVSNACKFTEEGSVTVVLDRADDHHIRIAVVDTGIGIPEDKLPRVFERFSQVDGSSTRRAGGSGLGLTITQQLVQMHGGEIIAQSTYGFGSTFSFNLPIHQEQAEPTK